jgi:mono/diheme cytochrome c family protein
VNILKAGVVLVPNFQNRVLLGTATFVGMLLLVGWIAVNEPARMDVFTQQYHGRSIENGALTFANTCATCHGIDGKGIKERAPALNNPMLFLKENPGKSAKKTLDDLTTQQATLKKQIEDYPKNVQALADANAKLKTVTPGSQDEKDLKTLIDDLNSRTRNFDLAKTQKQIDDLQPQIDQATADLKKLTADGWDPTRDPRLVEVKWTGKLQDYIISTVISGRPVSALYWPEPMPAWGQQSGGPLRMDEIIDVANYILNFQDSALNLKPSEVNQQFKAPGAAINVKLNESGKPVGSSPTVDVKALAQQGLTGGDPALGEQKYTALGCIGCHGQGITAPATTGTFTRILNVRLKDPANAGKTPEQYIAESIIHPNAYVVPNFPPGVMPQTFGDQLDIKDIKDLIAYLETQK